MIVDRRRSAEAFALHRSSFDLTNRSVTVKVDVSKLNALQTHGANGFPGHGHRLVRLDARRRNVHNERVPVAGRLRYLEALPRPDIRRRGTLLLLHAFPLNARMWEPQLAPFADRGWHAIAPHFRGFDLLEWSGVDASSDTTIDDYAGDVLDLLDALHIPDAVVVGLSMGGYVALAMLRLAPRYLHGLVLADTRPQADTPDGREGRTRLARLAHERGVAAVADELLPKLVGDTTRRDRHVVVATVRELALSNSVEAVVGALSAMMTRPDSTALLASIHIPTLIIVGDQDGITPPEAAEAMQHAIAGSARAVVPGAGHLSSLENTDAFNDALARFLEHRV